MSAKNTKAYYCNRCHAEQELPRWRYSKRLECDGIFLCNPCRRRKIWEERPIELKEKIKSAFKEGRKKWIQENPEEVKRIASKAGSGNKTNNGLSVRRQWDSVKANEVEYAKACARLKNNSVRFHSSMSDEQKSTHYKKIFKNKQSSTAADNCLSFIETAIDISLIREHNISGFFVDGLVLEKKVIIEFYGDSFHCNTHKFSNPDQFCSWIGRTVGEQWKRDKRREAALLKNGYTLVIIWERDWNTDREGQIRRVKNALYKKGIC